MNIQHLFRLRSLFTLPHDQRGTVKNKRVGKNSRARRLGLSLERCEDRRLLSGASITGTIYDTANSSGFSAGDVTQGGVFVDLYRDNGDNVFNPATDTRVDREQSVAATGAYTFNNVADGHYYIQEEVPTGFSQSAGPSFYTVDVTGVVVGISGSAQNIDDFNDPNPPFSYFINQINPNPLTQSFTGSTSDIIGGQRDLTVQVLGPANPISAEGFIGTDGTSKGVFNLGSASNGPGTEGTLHYNANGVGLAAKLTANGANGFLLNFDFLQVGTGTTMDMEASLTSPGGTASFATTLTQNTGAFSVFVPFSSLSTTGSFSLANTSSIQFSFNQNGVQDVDFELAQIETVDQQNSSFNFGNYPCRSCLAGYVYGQQSNDCYKNGTSQQPISGVTITLTGINDLGQSVMQSINTNSSGAYQFANLRPGTYQLTETLPAGYTFGADMIGTPGGTGTPGMIANVTLPPNFCGMNNNFQLIPQNSGKNGNSGGCDHNSSGGGNNGFNGSCGNNGSGRGESYNGNQSCAGNSHNSGASSGGTGKSGGGNGCGR